jgi:hypothetical protein
MPLNFPAPNIHQPIRSPYKDLDGLDYIAAKYRGFRKPPPKAPDVWQRGVLPDSMEMVQPEQIFGMTAPDLRSLQYWVATRRIEVYVRTRGLENVRAIGMLIC